MASYETLLVSKDDGIAWVSLNRPSVRNAINQQMQDELHDAWDGFRYDDDVRCIVLIGLVSEVVPRADLRDRAAWAARVIADAPALAIQGTMRALWTALEVPRTQAIGMANLFTRIGSDAAAFKAGQDRFASGERPQWRSR